MGLFLPGADAVLRAALWSAAALPIGGVVGLMILARSPLGNGSHEPIAQPLEFDHRHHASDDGIECRYCHEGAWLGPHAGVPPVERCMGCHAQIWNQSPQLQLLREAYFSHRPIRWARVHRLADFAFFDHSVHLARGLTCTHCHGQVESMAAVEQVQPLNMGWCIDCHRNPPVRDAAPRTECTTCHR